MCNESKFIRSEVSKKNKYYISKHEFYELRHLCLRYNELLQRGDIFDLESCLMIKKAIDTLPEWSKEVMFKSVTEGYSYIYASTVMEVPCGRETYYKLYRKFFYELSEVRKEYFRQHA